MAFKFTEEQLNTLDKSFIVELFLQLQEQNDKLSGEVQDLNKKIELLIEQITLSNKNRFGRSSEKMEDASQICFMEIDGTIVFFNEAEAVSDLDAEEPETLEPKPARKPKSVGKKDADLSGLPVNIITHYMTEEELVAEFGKNGWKQLPDAISKRYRFIPAQERWTNYKSRPSAGITSRKSGISNTCCSDYEWQVCQCCSSLSPGTGVFPLWS